MFLCTRKNPGNPIGFPLGTIVKNVSHSCNLGRNGIRSAVAHIPTMESGVFAEVLNSLFNRIRRRFTLLNIVTPNHSTKKIDPTPVLDELELMLEKFTIAITQDANFDMQIG